MKCAFCGNEETKVTDKRDSGEGVARRRRECRKCGKRFTTYERSDVEIVVIKKDKTREKLISGIKKACEKRPVAKEKIEKIVDKIEEKLRKRGKEIKSKFIGEQVMRALKKIDKVAYVRFASVYRDFQDLKDFKKEIRSLK